MSKGQGDILFGAIAIIVVCLLMAAMSGCDKQPLEEDITPGDSYATYGDVLDNSISIGFEEIETEPMPPEGFLRWVEGCEKSADGHLEYSTGSEWACVGIAQPVIDPNEPPVWGKGELPADHQGFFGPGNNSRLNYVQNRVLDKHAAILKILAIRVLALEAVDPNAMRLESLESGMDKLMDVGHAAVLTDVEAVE